MVTLPGLGVADFFGLKALAHSYERKGRFELAVPLFFQALRLCKDQCHLAVISKSRLTGSQSQTIFTNNHQ